MANLKAIVVQIQEKLDRTIERFEVDSRECFFKSKTFGQTKKKTECQGSVVQKHIKSPLEISRFLFVDLDGDGNDEYNGEA